MIEEASDIEALVNALRKWLGILNNSARAEKARAACASLASGFTLDRNLKETLEVIRKVISEKV